MSDDVLKEVFVVHIFCKLRGLILIFQKGGKTNEMTEGQGTDATDDQMDSKRSEEQGQDARHSMREEVMNVMVGFKAFLKDTMNLSEDANIEGAIETIKKDMVFKGYNVWILIVYFLHLRRL